MIRPQFIFILWLAWGTICLGTLAFIIARPKAWAAWIDKENDYWVARGFFSSKTAEKIKQLEKGAAMKILLFGNLLLSVTVLCLVFHFTQPRPFRAVLPPQPTPIPRRQPPH